jgi:uncharacterized membrane protein/protein-disulfide isomerase
MSPTVRRLILGFALLGLGFAGASTWVHYKLLTQPNYTSPCDLSAAFNCTQVYLSRFGSIGGVPVALGGVIWFALVALIAAFAKTGKDAPARSASGAYIFVLATIGLGFSLYLAYASFFVLKTGCVLCMGTYVAVIGIFVTAGIASAGAAGRVPGRLASDLRDIIADPVVFLVAVVFVVAGVSLVAFFPRENAIAQAASAPPVPVANDIEARFTEAWWKAPRVDLGIPLGDAKVLVVKFIDWQCPSCRNAYFAYKPVYERFAQSHPGLVKEVIKDFPLSDRCNYTIKGPAHQAACEAAAGARIARERKKLDEFVNWIFTVPDQQAVTAVEMREKVTTMLGLAPGEFDREYNARLTSIKQDVADGAILKVSSTPTYYINGVHARTASGWLPAEFFELGIKLELGKSADKEP